MDDESCTDSLPAGMTGRGLRRRRMARFMFVVAIVPAVLVALLLMSPSNGHGFQTGDPGLLVWAIVIGAGILGYVVGLALMIRIYRADPEAHRSFWRSRRY
jgi:drug/metabolite transporter (DMT)-like permease